MKNNNIILLLVIIVIMMYFFAPRPEKFSTSGLNMSDRYCDKLSTVYYKPRAGYKNGKIFKNKVCGRERRNTIGYDTGNYFTEYGQLV